jgi:hypothetical protein
MKILEMPTIDVGIFYLDQLSIGEKKIEFCSVLTDLIGDINKIN